MIVRMVDGVYYICRRTVGQGKGHKRFKTHKEGNLKKNYRNWYLVKNTDKEKSTGVINTGWCWRIGFPKEFIGKRVRFKVEVIE